MLKMDSANASSRFQVLMRVNKMSVGLVLSDETTLGDPRPDPVHSVQILGSCMEYFSVRTAPTDLGKGPSDQA